MIGVAGGPGLLAALPTVCPSLAVPRFGEVRRRTRSTGVVSNRTRIGRILFAVFAHKNRNQHVSAPFLLTQINCRYHAGSGPRSSRAVRYWPIEVSP